MDTDEIFRFPWKATIGADRKLFKNIIPQFSEFCHLGLRENSGRLLIISISTGYE